MLHIIPWSPEVVGRAGFHFEVAPSTFYFGSGSNGWMESPFWQYQDSPEYLETLIQQQHAELIEFYKRGSGWYTKAAKAKIRAFEFLYVHRVAQAMAKGDVTLVFEGDDSLAKVVAAAATRLTEML